MMKLKDKIINDLNSSFGALNTAKIKKISTTIDNQCFIEYGWLINNYESDYLRIDDISEDLNYMFNIVTFGDFIKTKKEFSIVQFVAFDFPQSNTARVLIKTDVSEITLMYSVIEEDNGLK